MEHDKCKPEAAEIDSKGNGPLDPPVIDLEDYQVVKPDSFHRRGKKSDKEDS